MIKLLAAHMSSIVVIVIMSLISLYLKWRIYRINHVEGITWDDKPWDEAKYRDMKKEQL